MTFTNLATVVALFLIVGCLSRPGQGATAEDSVRVRSASATDSLSTQTPDNLAWWLTARFTPADSIIGGLPLSAIEPTWTLATVLTVDLMSKEGFSDPYNFESGFYEFGRSGDFNHDGFRDSVLVGVYQKPNDTGSFILILTEQNPGDWQPSFLHETSGAAYFSILHGAGDTLRWSGCMECDSFGRLAWVKDRYEWLPPLDYQ
ncbi:MAG: hypothetical protein OEZ54_12670 [Gemmatimonadota bacterium]|nr:hypothetical protein [Gemmatimonadota bacterium]